MITMTASFARIPAKAARAKLSATDWDVLHAIGLHADKDGRAYPSMARIAEIAGIQRSNVPRSVCRLKERGILRHNRIARPSGGWQVNQYQLLFEPMGDVISADDTEAGVFSVQTTGDVVSVDDTEAGVFSAQTTGDVLDADNTPSKGVITGDNICSHHRQQGVICVDALTDHLTNQGTDPYQEEVSEVVLGEVNDQGVVAADNISAEPVPGLPPGKANPEDRADIVVDPARPCGRYVIGDYGHRLCGKPSELGTDRCVAHILRVVGA